MRDITCHSVLLCDDIRVEKNDKFFFIGAYTSGVRLQKIPGNLPVCLYLGLKFERNGKFQLKIIVEAGEQKHEIGVGVEVLNFNEYVAIPTPRFLLAITEETDLVVSLAVAGNDSEVVAKYPITQNPEIWTPFPNEIEPPSGQSQSDVQD